MKVLVCGGRDFNDADLLNESLSTLQKVLQDKHQDDIDLIIHGAAKGADTLAKLWAEANDIETKSFPANWNKHGKAAGPIRNQRMIDEGKPDMVVAFPGGVGTAYMINRALKAKIKLMRICYDAIQ